jgi:hypothetical protein
MTCRLLSSDPRDGRTPGSLAVMGEVVHEYRSEVLRSGNRVDNKVCEG